MDFSSILIAFIICVFIWIYQLIREYNVKSQLARYKSEAHSAGIKALNQYHDDHPLDAMIRQRLAEYFAANPSGHAIALQPETVIQCSNGHILLLTDFCGCPACHSSLFRVHSAGFSAPLWKLCDHKIYRDCFADYWKYLKIKEVIGMHAINPSLQKQRCPLCDIALECENQQKREADVMYKIEYELWLRENPKP